MRDSEGRQRMKKTGKKGSMKGAVGGNYKESAVCRKGEKRCL